MSTRLRTLRHIEAIASDALCQISTLTPDGRNARRALERIGKSANTELSKAPIAKMRRGDIEDPKSYK
jgi:hypothetical protein